MQRLYEEERLDATLRMLRAAKIAPHQKRVKEAREKLISLEKSADRGAKDYPAIKALEREIAQEKEAIEGFRPFFEDPYFARMDLVDEKEGYNSYYIGKKGDVRLEIVDWRAPVAKRYYQKSCAAFSFNEFAFNRQFMHC